jgi:hypothetical protein
MSYEGVMFYSTDPASDGYVLTSEGNTVRKTAASTASAATATASATAAASATATPSPLPTSGGPSLLWPLTSVAALVLVGLGVVGLALLRRGYS